jgi:hypothetical protein
MCSVTTNSSTSCKCCTQFRHGQLPTTQEWSQNSTSLKSEIISPTFQVRMEAFIYLYIIWSFHSNSTQWSIHMQSVMSPWSYCMTFQSLSLSSPLLSKGPCWGNWPIHINIECKYDITLTTEDWMWQCLKVQTITTQQHSWSPERTSIYIFIYINLSHDSLRKLFKWQNISQH